MRSSLESKGDVDADRYCLPCDADYAVELEYNRATGLEYWECDMQHGHQGEIEND